MSRWYWRRRKEEWLSLGIKSGEGRGNKVESTTVASGGSNAGLTRAAAFLTLCSVSAHTSGSVQRAAMFLIRLLVVACAGLWLPIPRLVCTIRG